MNEWMRRRRRRRSWRKEKVVDHEGATSNVTITTKGVLISIYPDQKGNKLMFLSELHEFPSAPCLAGKKKLDESSIMLKSRASLTCFRACFLPGRAKDLSAPRYYCHFYYYHHRHHHHSNLYFMSSLQAYL